MRFRWTDEVAAELLERWMEITRPVCARCGAPFGSGEPMLAVEPHDGAVRRWVHDWDCAPGAVDQTGWAQRSLDRWRDGVER